VRSHSSNIFVLYLYVWLDVHFIFIDDVILYWTAYIYIYVYMAVEPSSWTEMDGSKLDRWRTSLPSTDTGVCYCVGGTEPRKQPIKLYFQDKNDHPECLQVPLERFDDPKLEKLLETCEIASFGRGGQTLVDETVRKALRKPASSVACTFDLHSTSILTNVSRALGTSENRSLRVVPYMLNVYLPGGYFADHVDTPLGRNHVGSLIIALPTHFTGGELEVSHGEHTSTFGLSAASTEINWVALYADCRHKIHKVQSGCRLTLTYHLFNSLPEDDVR
jgi:hypothetical protein